MPAQSQQQQKLFGLALAFKRGEVPSSEVSDEIKAIADRMSEKEIEDFAATKHKGLPKKMKEQLRKIVREIMRERAISEIELSKAEMDKLHSDGEVEVDGEKVTYDESINEDENPCWDGYEMVGMKMKDGKEVPNCVPKNESVNEAYIVTYTKKRGEKPASAAFQLRGSALSFERDLKKDGYITMVTQKKVKGIDESVNEGRKSKDDWGVRLVIAIHNNVHAIVELVMRDKRDPKEVMSAFANPLLNSVKGVSKHNYKPNAKPAYTLKRDLQHHGDLTNQQRLDIFKSEIKKFEKIVEALIKKPTKVGVKRLDDAWRTIWNYKYGANIGLNGGGPHDNTIIEVSSYTTNEAASRTAMEIGGLTGMNKDAIQKFVDSNELDIEKVFQFVKKGKLKDRMDLVSAIAGKPNNPIQKKMIKMFKESVNEGKPIKMNALDWGKSTAERNANLDKYDSLKTDKERESFLRKLKGESVNEGASSEEKRIVMMAIKKIAKYRNVPLHFAVNDVIRAAEELERTIGKK